MDVDSLLCVAEAAVAESPFNIDYAEVSYYRSQDTITFEWSVFGPFAITILLDSNTGKVLMKPYLSRVSKDVDEV